MTPGNSKKMKGVDIENQNEQYSSKQQVKSLTNCQEQNEGMKQFMKTNSAVYKMRKLNEAKLDICKQQNIDIKGNSFKNIGIIDDVELPKYVLNKLKNQNNVIYQLKRGTSPSKHNNQISNLNQLPSMQSPHNKYPKKNRSISQNYPQNIFQLPSMSSPQKNQYYDRNEKNRQINYNINQVKTNERVFENEFEKIKSIISVPVQEVENEKLKFMINQLKYIDSQQYKTKASLPENTLYNPQNKSTLIKSGNKEDSPHKIAHYQRSVSPISVRNKNQSILMHKIMLSPLKNKENQTNQLEQYSIHWDHTPFQLPQSPLLIQNPQVNYQELKLNQNEQ